MACIEAHGLRKAFGATIALQGIDLRVEEGCILGLIGPNGAGKTTALRAIAGLLPITDGSIRLDDTLWDEPPRTFRSADHRPIPRTSTSRCRTSRARRATHSSASARA